MTNAYSVTVKVITESSKVFAVNAQDKDSAATEGAQRMLEGADFKGRILSIEVIEEEHDFDGELREIHDEIAREEAGE